MMTTAIKSITEKAADETAEQDLVDENIYQQLEDSDCFDLTPNGYNKFVAFLDRNEVQDIDPTKEFQADDLEQAHYALITSIRKTIRGKYDPDKYFFHNERHALSVAHNAILAIKTIDNQLLERGLQPVPKKCYREAIEYALAHDIVQESDIDKHSPAFEDTSFLNLDQLPEDKKLDATQLKAKIKRAGGNNEVASGNKLLSLANNITVNGDKISEGLDTDGITKAMEATIPAFTFESIIPDGPKYLRVGQPNLIKQLTADTVNIPAIAVAMADLGISYGRYAPEIVDRNSKSEYKELSQPINNNVVRIFQLMANNPNVIANWTDDQLATQLESYIGADYTKLIYRDAQNWLNTQEGFISWQNTILAGTITQLHTRIENVSPAQGKPKKIDTSNKDVPSTITHLVNGFDGNIKYITQVTSSFKEDFAHLEQAEVGSTTTELLVQQLDNINMLLSLGYPNLEKARAIILERLTLRVETKIADEMLDSNIDENIDALMRKKEALERLQTQLSSYSAIASLNRIKMKLISKIYRALGPRL